jgi:hypothetical protein
MYEKQRRRTYNGMAFSNSERAAKIENIETLVGQKEMRDSESGETEEKAAADQELSVPFEQSPVCSQIITPRLRTLDRISAMSDT